MWSPADLLDMMKARLSGSAYDHAVCGARACCAPGRWVAAAGGPPRNPVTEAAQRAKLKRVVTAAHEI